MIEGRFGDKCDASFWIAFIRFRAPWAFVINCSQSKKAYSGANFVTIGADI